jgi:hypothetical protein
MQTSESSALDVPGERRRIARFRSWWNKQELYPPSVGRWFRLRATFFRAEREHARQWQGGVPDELRAAAHALWNRDTGALWLHVSRGAAMCFCRPLSVLHWGGKKDTDSSQASGECIKI